LGAGALCSSGAIVFDHAITVEVGGSILFCGIGVVVVSNVGVGQFSPGSFSGARDIGFGSANVVGLCGAVLIVGGIGF
jgi:hypothetical protein